MYIHEYQAKQLLAAAGLPVAKGFLATTATEAEFAYLRLQSDVAVIKAQVHAGGRGEGGGVRLVRSAAEAATVAEGMLGSTLVTKQTGGEGKLVHAVYVEAGCEIASEAYVSLSVDRASAQIMLMYSAAGGTDIETVAAEHPEKIIQLMIDPAGGFKTYHLWQLQHRAQVPADLLKPLAQLITGLTEVFVKYDLQQLEINPLALLSNGRYLVLDAKFDFDDNALFRHPEIVDLRDYKEENPRELEASKYGLSYVGLEGNIGCLVNGAGLAMATMDIIKLRGGEPLNFLDVGGGASKEQVKNAIGLILKEPQLKAILVNIFGGIMHCDIIAQGIVDSVQELGGLKVPLVVRLEGTHVELGRQILKDSQLELVTVASMDEGAQKVVELAARAGGD